MIVTADASGRNPRVSDRREVVIKFKPTEVAAPFLLRCGAVFVDYIIVVAAPVLGLVLNRLIDSGYGSAAGELSNATAWFIAVLLGLSNVILFPVLSGQTMGMMLAGLRIVTMDGRQPSVTKILLRHTVGYLLTMATLGLGFALAAITPRGRALHDYLSGTMVIYATKHNI